MKNTPLNAMPCFLLRCRNLEQVDELLHARGVDLLPEEVRAAEVVEEVRAPPVAAVPAMPSMTRVS